MLVNDITSEALIPVTYRAAFMLIKKGVAPVWVSWKNLLRSINQSNPRFLCEMAIE
jgi:hypothetical protein